MLGASNLFRIRFTDITIHQRPPIAILDAKYVAILGRAIKVDGQVAGRVCSSGWSPYQGCGVAIVRMDDPTQGPGTPVKVEGIDGSLLEGELCTLPMYDKNRAIPRGKLVDIPTQPIPRK